MSEVTVRRVKFEFPDELDDVLPGADLVSESYLVAFSFTMPALEPYLIRTARAVAPRITDTTLAEDVDGFIGQEAQHFQNHRRVNEMVLRQLGDPAAAKIRDILSELDDEYRRFTSGRSDEFNLVYAEGFEAMTCAMAMSMFESAGAGASGPGSNFGPWRQLWTWHAAEEIEHRTVAFALYEHLVGSYPRRAIGSMRAQLHFQRYIGRLQRVVLADRGEKPRRHVPPWLRTRDGFQRFIRTYRSSYDPANLSPPPLTETVLAMFGEPAG